MRISLDDELEDISHDAQATPILFEPHVDWSAHTEPTIIHAF
ncbi:MAG: hypothetical protein ACREDR_25425 [Blastocatellia bacterium]